MPRKLSPEAAARQTAKQMEIHKATLERIAIDAPKGMREIYKAKAKARGVSLNRLVLDYLDSLE